MEGDGMGRFTYFSTLNPMGLGGNLETCFDFVIADFNGDTKPDIAASFGSTHTLVLRGMATERLPRQSTSRSLRQE